MRVCDIHLIRHARSDAGNTLAGRRDVPAILPGASELAAIRMRLPHPGRLIVSPAARCVATAEALFPGIAAESDARLLEQDFGAWEGQDPATMPDLGPMDRVGLAAHRPPDGESFAELCARMRPAFEAMAGQEGTIIVVAHAGTVRAALSLALGHVEAGLAFEIAPLSATHLRVFDAAHWSIAGVNHPLLQTAS